MALTLSSASGSLPPAEAQRMLGALACPTAFSIGIGLLVGGGGASWVLFMAVPLPALLQGGVHVLFTEMVSFPQSSETCFEYMLQAHDQSFRPSDTGTEQLRGMSYPCAGSLCLPMIRQITSCIAAFPSRTAKQKHRS